MKSYIFGETQGFPYESTTADLDVGNSVVATDLASDVTKLHQFLFGENDYTPVSYTHLYITWYEFAKEIFAQAGMDVNVVPVTSDKFPAKAKRPHNLSLIHIYCRWSQRLSIDDAPVRKQSSGAGRIQ